jgi:uncharacterized protein (DUF2141 family)
MRSLLPLLVAMMLIAPGDDAGADGSGTLTVRVIKLRSQRGQVVALLYRSDDGFARNEAHAWRRVVAPIVGGAAELRFGDVPPGAYAVFAFHDENGNGTLERSFLGAPKEGVALSNDARGHLGPPKFKDARFEHQQANEILNLSTVYL